MALKLFTIQFMAGGTCNRQADRRADRIIVKSYLGLDLF